VRWREVDGKVVEGVKADVEVEGSRVDGSSDDGSEDKQE
jgi:hypothetical protein